jgi:hypothetical protein
MTVGERVDEMESWEILIAVLGIVGLGDYGVFYTHGYRTWYGMRI